VTNRTPRLSGKQVLRALQRDGWYKVSQVGDHVQMRHADTSGKVTVMDTTETLKPKTLASICNQSGLTAEQLKDLS
jgi:predicted RNA binding protein YcfA (HicA-like mRNA interferase family)